MNIYLHPSGVKKELKNDYIGEVWTPGANTILYYDFNNNINDQSGNGNDATSSGTISYGTNYINLISGYLILPQLTYSAPLTVVLWEKCNAGSNTGFILHIINQAHTKMIISFEGSGLSTDFPSFSPYYYTYNTNWQLIVVTYDTSEVKYYINGTLVATKSGWSTAPGLSNGACLGAGWNGNGGNPQLYAGKYIMESKVWSAQNVTDYYNLTKADYGL